MCGIVGAIAQRDVAKILLEGLKRLEYRGYDSAGMAVLREKIERLRMEGKVKNLVDSVNEQPLPGSIGIAHTRWATHGKPSERNAHPFYSPDEKFALVHNGIIENHAELRQELLKKGYEFKSDTDSEVVVHLLHRYFQKTNNVKEAFIKTTKRLEGAYALAMISEYDINHIYGVRSGSAFVIGLGIGENFLASDVLALLPVTKRFIYLEEGDLVQLSRDEVHIFDQHGKPLERKIHELDYQEDAVDRGEYRHFMQKEIFEQSRAIADTIESRLSDKGVMPAIFGENAESIFKEMNAIQIVACGTSYHAGLAAQYWIEAIAGVPCQVEVASEFRYRKQALHPKTLFIAISQSGETADTLAALREFKAHPHCLSSLGICNVANSSLIRESDLVFLTRAGAEIGVASTKAFTTQLTGLLMLTFSIAQARSIEIEPEAIKALKELPNDVEKILNMTNKTIQDLAQEFSNKENALFLGRGVHYPIALEGALKLKEISYIHAEAYPAGELKHGPLALVDKDMPVITIAPNDQLLEKLKSNIEEVRARGGELIVLGDMSAKFPQAENVHFVPVTVTNPITSPIVYTIPLQLLAYYVALIKGTDVDQPRNLAKSVTVE